MKVKFMVAAVAACASWSVLAAGTTAVTTVSAGTPYPVCDGTGTAGKTDVWGGPGNVLAPTDVPVFTRAGFAIQCSSNVFMSINEVSPTVAVVGSASAKGNQYFGGHSNGGAIAPIAKCAASGGNACDAADVTSALQAAEAAAGGSS